MRLVKNQDKTALERKLTQLRQAIIDTLNSPGIHINGRSYVLADKLIVAINEVDGDL